MNPRILIKGGRNSLEATCAGALALLLLATAPASSEEPNLLTQNPGFEAPGDFAFFHGDYSLPGWKGNNPLFASHRVADGEATEGKRRMRMEWGGTISTAPDARPP